MPKESIQPPSIRPLEAAEPNTALPSNLVADPSSLLKQRIKILKLKKSGTVSNEASVSAEKTNSEQNGTDISQNESKKCTYNSLDLD